LAAALTHQELAENVAEAVASGVSVRGMVIKRVGV
jgi:hypothetical protein